MKLKGTYIGDSKNESGLKVGVEYTFSLRLNIDGTVELFINPILKGITYFSIIGIFREWVNVGDNSYDVNHISISEETPCDIITCIKIEGFDTKELILLNPIKIEDLCASDRIEFTIIDDKNGSRYSMFNEWMRAVVSSIHPNSKLRKTVSLMNSNLDVLCTLNNSQIIKLSIGYIDSGDFDNFDATLYYEKIISST